MSSFKESIDNLLKSAGLDFEEYKDNNCYLIKNYPDPFLQKSIKIVVNISENPTRKEVLTLANIFKEKKAHSAWIIAPDHWETDFHSELSIFCRQKYVKVFNSTNIYLKFVRDYSLLCKYRKFPSKNEIFTAGYDREIVVNVNGDEIEAYKMRLFKYDNRHKLLLAKHSQAVDVIYFLGDEWFKQVWSHKGMFDEVFLINPEIMPIRNILFNNNFDKVEFVLNNYITKENCYVAEKPAVQFM